MPSIIARRPLVAAGLFLATGARAATAPTAAHGMDPARLDATLAEAARLPRLKSMIVARDGAILTERVFHGGGLDQPTNIKSASKSVISALVGIAIQRGVLEGLDQPIAPLLGARVPRGGDSRLARITVGNLLSMQAGLARTSGANYGAWVTSRDWVRYALSQPFEAEPGGAMLYSTGSTHLLSAVLTAASTRSTLELAREWLGRPLDITVPPWPRDPQGIYFGGNDMLLSPHALLRFGEMYRQGGMLDGRRVLPAAWIEQSWTPRAHSSWSGQAYGLGWWIAGVQGHPVYFAWGYGGQMIYVLPDLAMTVVMTSDAEAPRDRDHRDALHRLLAEGLVAAMGAPPGNGAPRGARSLMTPFGGAEPG